MENFFPFLYTSNYPKWLRVNVAFSRKPLLITNQELSFACISISQVSIIPHCKHLPCAKASSKQGRKYVLDKSIRGKKIATKVGQFQVGIRSIIAITRWCGKSKKRQLHKIGKPDMDFLKKELICWQCREGWETTTHWRNWGRMF